MKTHLGKPRRLGLRIGVCAALATTTLVHPASGYTLSTTWGCSSVSWSAPTVNVVVHTAEFGSDLDQLGAMLHAVSAVHHQVNVVGASSAHLTQTSTTAPFTYRSWYGDRTPTIHVGFVPSFADPDRVGETTRGPISDCRYTEAHIALLHPGMLSFWNFGVPRDAGEKYYDAGERDASYATYFRPWYLHELLHAFGLEHSATSYTFMNYGEHPWANRADDDTIRPLPGDAAALRHLYPAAGSRTDVAVLTTGLDPRAVSHRAATQHRLCKPSLGDTYSAGRFDDFCGVGGPDTRSTTVCPGDPLHTRFTIANYSTEPVDVTAQVWLSLDDQHHNTDLMSPTTHRFTVGQTSRTLQLDFTVPTLHGAAPGTQYHVIVQVHATGQSTGTTVHDWIPMRGTLEPH